VPRHDPAHDRQRELRHASAIGFGNCVKQASNFEALDLADRAIADYGIDETFKRARIFVVGSKRASL
jgi:hypothetical protein